MSTASLRELIQTIKTRSQALAGATGAGAANARDLVYLSTAVERLFGADALLDLLDTAARPAEVINVSAPGTTTVTLSTDQATKEVIVFRPGAGTFTASNLLVIAPNRGFSAVIDNELVIPVHIKTAAQTNHVVIAAGQKGWIYCDGTDIEFVVDVAAITAALQSPLTTTGDLLYRDANGQQRLPIGAPRQNLIVGQNSQPIWRNSGFRPHTRIKALPNNYIPENEDGTFVTGGTAISLTPTARLSNYINTAPVFPHAANMGTWDVGQLDANSHRGAAAIAEDGGFFVWGAATSGRNGSISGQNKLPYRPPLFVSTSEGIQPVENGNFTIKQIASSYDYTAVVTSNGEVFSTGIGTSGQQGDGSVSSRAFFRRVDFPADAGPVRYLLSGAVHGSSSMSVFALMEDGDVYAWGLNTNGQLGLGDAVNRTTPTKIPTFNQNVRAVYNRGTHTAFITNDNQLFMCGRNANGEIGVGSTVDVNTPTLINIGGPVVKVALNGDAVLAANGWTLAIRADGRLYAWGHNATGQLGDNSTTNRSSPVLVSTIGVSAGEEVIDVWCGGGNLGISAALTKNGNFYTWGNNAVGQLGLGDTTNRLQPTLHSRVKWVSDVAVLGNPGTNQMVVLALHHENLADRIARRNGTTFSAGHNNFNLGRPNTAASSNAFNVVGYPNFASGKIRYIVGYGVHVLTTYEHASLSLDEEGVLHHIGYDVANFQSGRADLTLSDFSAVQVHII